MNLVGTITRDEAKVLISKETGRTIVGDGEIIMLHSADLNAIKAADALVHDIYFGEFQHGTSNSLAVSVNKETYNPTEGADVVTHATDIFNPPCQSKNTMWNILSTITGAETEGGLMFYGYKFTLKTAWDLMTLGSFANGAGWAIADDINVHSSGTTEAAYGFEFAAKKYRLTVDFSGITTGSCLVRTDNVVIETVTSDGVQVFEFDGDETDTTIFFIPTTDFDGGYDTATIKLEEFNKY